MKQPEVRPQVTYEAQGGLIFNLDSVAAFDQEDASADLGRRHELYDEAIDSIVSFPGVQASTDDERLTVHTDIKALLGDTYNEPVWGDSLLGRYLDAANRIMHYSLDDTTDRVCTIQSLNGRVGCYAWVNKSMHDWLNEDSINTDVWRETVQAMAEPHGAEVRGQAEEGYSYVEFDDGFRAGSTALLVRVDERQFCVSSRITTDEGEQGWDERSVNWKTIRLETIGSCACLETSGAARDAVMRSETAKLYRLLPHNVDTPRAALSHLLGIGVLSRHVEAYANAQSNNQVA